MPWAWWGVIWLSLLLPGDGTLPPAPAGSDLVIHCALFAIWTALWEAVARPCAWRVLGVAALTAVASETLQALVIPSRYGDWRDAAADLVGAVLGVALMRGCRRWRRHRDARRARAAPPAPDGTHSADAGRASDR